MQKLISIFILFIFTIPWREPIKLVDPKVEFAIDNAGIAVNGTFDEVEIILIPIGENKVKLEGKAKPENIHSGIGIRDKHMQKPDYFDSEKFPEILIETEPFELKKKGANEVLLHVRIKGNEKIIPAHLSIDSDPAWIIFNAEFTMNRLDFQLGKESIILSDEVKVRVSASLVE